MHIGATKSIRYKGVVKQPCAGVGTVERREGVYYYRLNIEGAVMTLGAWWMRAARLGTVDVLPIVNLNPTFAHPSEECGQGAGGRSRGGSRGVVEDGGKDDDPPDAPPGAPGLKKQLSDEGRALVAAGLAGLAGLGGESKGEGEGGSSNGKLVRKTAANDPNKADTLDNFFKFPRTRHLVNTGGSSVTRDDLVMDAGELASFVGPNGRVLTIEEKLDGANLGISLDTNYQVLCQNRSHYVSAGCVRFVLEWMICSFPRSFVYDLVRLIVRSKARRRKGRRSRMHIYII